MSEEQRGSRTRSESLGRREGNRDCFPKLENGRGECCWDKKTVHLRLRCTLSPFFRLLIVSPHNQVSHVTLRSWIVVYNAVDSQLGHLSVFDWLQDQNLNLPLRGCLLSSLTSSVTVCLFRCYKFRQSTFDLPLFTYYFVTFLWSISRKYSNYLVLRCVWGLFLVMQVHMKEVKAVQTANRLTAVYLIKDMMEVLTPVGKLGCCCSIK